MTMRKSYQEWVRRMLALLLLLGGSEAALACGLQSPAESLTSQAVMFAESCGYWLPLVMLA